MVPMELDPLQPAMDTTEIIDVRRKGPETGTVVMG